MEKKDANKKTNKTKTKVKHYDSDDGIKTKEPDKK